MPKQPKPKSVGRPALPKGNAKDVMLRVRVTPDKLKAFEELAKANKQTVSEFVRSTLYARLEA